MSDLQSCLATFVVSAWANDGSGLERAERVIEAYLAKCETRDHKAALLALEAAYRKMPADSHVAQQIKARIESRIAALPGRDETHPAELGNARSRPGLQRMQDDDAHPIP